MKIQSLSQSCASIFSPGCYNSNNHINSGSNTTRFLAKTSSINGNNKALQKTYCLSSICFLGCLSIVYGIAAYAVSGGKCKSNIARIV